MGCDGHGNINAHIIGGYVPGGTLKGVNFEAFPHADAPASIGGEAWLLRQDRLFVIFDPTSLRRSSRTGIARLSRQRAHQQ